MLFFSLITNIFFSNITNSSPRRRLEEGKKKNSSPWANKKAGAIATNNYVNAMPVDCFGQYDYKKQC